MPNLYLSHYTENQRFYATKTVNINKFEKFKVQYFTLKLSKLIDISKKVAFYPLYHCVRISSISRIFKNFKHFEKFRLFQFWIITWVLYKFSKNRSNNEPSPSNYLSLKRLYVNIETRIILPKKVFKEEKHHSKINWCRHIIFYVQNKKKEIYIPTPISLLTFKRFCEGS